MEDDDALKDPTLDRLHSDALQIQAGLIHSKAAAIERLAAARASNAAAMRAEAAALRELQAAEACYRSETPKKIPPQKERTLKDDSVRQTSSRSNRPRV